MILSFGFSNIPDLHLSTCRDALLIIILSASQLATIGLAANSLLLTPANLNLVILSSISLIQYFLLPNIETFKLPSNSISQPPNKLLVLLLIALNSRSVKLQNNTESVSHNANFLLGFLTLIIFLYKYTLSFAVTYEAKALFK